MGVALVLALSAVLAYGLGVWLRRGWAIPVVLALPCELMVFPLLPGAVSGCP
ncbi:hypothetical protein ACIBIZ_20175 [Nonomuraea spiralis]|uniref:hypothetical protein n=1 Tax=Nonomuraea spiralis TaxID=46182 RepID=UPI0037B9F3CF